MNKEAKKFMIDTLKSKSKLDIDKIAKETGVSTRSVYRYINNENQGISHKIEDEIIVQFILNSTEEEDDEFLELMKKKEEK